MRFSLGVRGGGGGPTGSNNPRDGICLRIHTLPFFPEPGGTENPWNIVFKMKEERGKHMPLGEEGLSKGTQDQPQANKEKSARHSREQEGGSPVPPGK